MTSSTIGAVATSSRGVRGAVAAAHPLARDAALETLARGGSAVDATIAAHAVIAVVMPHAAGLGGDMIALVRPGRGDVQAINGTGLSPQIAPETWRTDGGSSVTVPGLVAGWVTAHERWGRLRLSEVLAESIRIAHTGYRVDAGLAHAFETQRSRLRRYGGDRWSLATTAVGDNWMQPELAELLDAIGRRGSSAFYHGDTAAHIATEVAAHGGTLSVSDLAAHRTDTPEPIETPWHGGRLIVQPPSTQGVLLAMAARWLDAAGLQPDERLQHTLIEVTEAAFAHRDATASAGSALLETPLTVDPDMAMNRGGPRAYLHTAGVAVADADGMVVSSLVSVFDDFGSAVFVPELGITLNNRAAGFTAPPNQARPATRPVHTLAPAMLVDREGHATGIATPGADGQVQTLLQVLAHLRYLGLGLDEAIAHPRWRSEAGALLIEDGHPDAHDLEDRGHHTVARALGDDVFGAVVAAGYDTEGPFAVGDWRRNVVTGAQ